MKNIEILSHRARVSLSTNYYHSFLSTEDDQKIEAALQKSQTNQLSLLQYLSLKMIQQCQQWSCLQGEIAWQNAAAVCITQLMGRKWKPDQRRIWLHQVDDLIETACVTQIVRQNIHQIAKDRQIPSMTWVQDYLQSRQTYQQQREALILLESQVKHIGKVYCELTGKPNVTTMASPHGITQTSPSDLPSYSKESTEMRLSDRYVAYKIQVEKDSRVVYQELCQEAIKTPIHEILAQHVQKGKQRLTDYAGQIFKIAGNLQKNMQQDHNTLISHRNQIFTAHNKRIGLLSDILGKIIQTCCAFIAERQANLEFLNDYSRHALTSLVDLAQEIKYQLQNNLTSIDTAAIQEKILTINTHRQSYEKSIIPRYRFFQCFSQAQYHREKINKELKNHIANMVVPVCNLRDREGVVTDDQLQTQQRWFKALVDQKAHLKKRTKKIEEIYIPTGKSPCI